MPFRCCCSVLVHCWFAVINGLNSPQNELHQLREFPQRKSDLKLSSSAAASIDWSSSPVVPPKNSAATAVPSSQVRLFIGSCGVNNRICLTFLSQVSSFINQVVISQLSAISKLPSMVGIGECERAQGLPLPPLCLRLNGYCCLCCCCWCYAFIICQHQHHHRHCHHPYHHRHSAAVR